jgi:hypothetical protein
MAQSIDLCKVTELSDQIPELPFDIKHELEKASNPVRKTNLTARAQENIPEGLKAVDEKNASLATRSTE